MADDISKLNQDLQNTVRISQEATQRISELKVQLEALVRAASPSSHANAVSGTVNRLLSGSTGATSYDLIGGTSAVSASLPEINRITQQIAVEVTKALQIAIQESLKASSVFPSRVTAAQGAGVVPTEQGVLATSAEAARIAAASRSTSRGVEPTGIDYTTKGLPDTRAAVQKLIQKYTLDQFEQQYQQLKVITTKPTTVPEQETTQMLENISKQADLAIQDVLDSRGTDLDKLKLNAARVAVPTQSSRDKQEFLDKINKDAEEAVKKILEGKEEEVRESLNTPYMSPMSKFTSATIGPYKQSLTVNDTLSKEEADRAEAALQAERSAAAAALQKKQEAEQRAYDRAHKNDPFVYTRESVSSALGGRQDIAENVMNTAAAKGFTEADIKKVQDFNNGYKQLIFSQKTEDGVLKTLNLTVSDHGQILVSTQNKLRTFGDSIVRNIGEALKWSIAIGVIYGPLQKLQELMQTAIDNQSKLADVAIVLGKNTSDMSAVFASAGRVAAATGESINGVLDAYVQAYRSVGGITDATEKATVAEKLLTDSLVLAKLGNISTSEAIDTMVAALNQANLPLDKGAVLLNKWLAVTRTANVDMNTLASSFSITAAAADSAGLSFDEINGLVATLASNTELAATEVGNAFRAIVTGFTTDKARNELEQFGISTQTATGESRKFMEVMTQVSDFYKKGLISEDQLLKIGEAWGGGARRGPQVVALIKNLDQAQREAGVSAGTTSNVYDSMATKLDTAQNAITQLGNSFQTLAQSMGNKGGILEVFTLLTNLLGGVVTGISTMTESLGPVAPVMAVLGASLAYANHTGYLNGLGSKIGEFGANVGKAAGLPSWKEGMTGTEIINYTSSKTTAEDVGNKFKQIAPWVGTTIGEAAILAMNIKSRDFGGIAGQAIGGAAGLALGGGPAGVMIGSVIGQTILDALKQKPENLSPNAVNPSSTTGAASAANLSQTDLNTKLLNLMPGGQTGAGILYNLYKLGSNNVPGGSGAYSPSAEYRGSRQNTSAPSNLTNTGYYEWYLKQNNPKAYEQWKKEQQNYTDETNKSFGTTSPRKSPTQLTYAGDISGIAQKEKDVLREQRNQQEISSKAYAEAITRLDNVNSQASFGFDMLKDKFKSSSEAFQFMVDLIARATPEQATDLANLQTEVYKYQKAIEDAKKAGSPVTEQMLADLKNATNDYKETAQAVAQLEKQQQLSKVKLPSVTDATGLKQSDYQKVLSEAYSRQSQYYQSAGATLGLSQTDIQTLISNLDPFFIYLRENFDEVGKYIKESGLDPKFWQEAMSDMEKAGKITLNKQSTFGVQSIDANKGDFMAAYQKMYSFVQSNFPQYKMQDKDAQGVIFKNNVTDVLHLDNLVTQLALQQLNETAAKQLDGIYNLPTDASFYVPLQAAAMRPDKTGKTGGGSGAGTGDTNSTALNSNTDALRQLKDALTKNLNTEFYKYNPKTTTNPISTYYNPQGPNAYKYSTTKDYYNSQGPNVYKYSTVQPSSDNSKDYYLPTAQGYGKGMISKGTNIGGSVDLSEIPSAVETIIKELFSGTTGTASAGISTSRGAGPRVPNPTTTDSTDLGTIISKWLKDAFTSLTNGTSNLQEQYNLNKSYLDMNKYNEQHKYENTQTLGSASGTASGSVGSSSAVAEISKAISALPAKLSTNLNMNINNRTILTVDGRVLADIIKPYLYTDAVNNEQSAGSTVSVGVI